MTQTARDLMRTELLTIRPEQPLSELLLQLEEGNFHGAPVIDSTGRPLGVVSRTDVAAALTDGSSPREPARPGVALATAETEPRILADPDLTATDVMSDGIVAIQPDATVGAIARRMVTERVHRILVIDDGNLVGLISATDLLEYLADTAR